MVVDSIWTKAEHLLDVVLFTYWSHSVDFHAELSAQFWVRNNSLGVPPNTLSANLNVLSHAELIGSRREGRSIIYTASYDRMAGLLGFLMEDCCQGASEICAPLAEVVNRAACCAAENETAQS